MKKKIRRGKERKTGEEKKTKKGKGKRKIWKVKRRTIRNKNAKENRKKT